MKKIPPELYLNYEQILQTALLSVVRSILENVEAEGLKGDHHYYIKFLTNHPKTQLSDKLKDEYPQEITIALQYQFWDLKIDEDGFYVRLGFGARFENIYVPFEALLGFSDPAAEFALPFKPATNKTTSKQPKAEVAKITNSPKPKKSNSTKSKNTKSNPLSDNVISLDTFRTTKN